MTTISAPAFITVGDAVRGSKVRVEWGEVEGAFAYIAQRSVNGVAFGTNDRETYSVDGPAMTDVEPVGEDWNTVQFRVQAVGYDDNNKFLYSDWTTSAVKTVTSAPEPPDSARLEQFQNNAGEIIYPQTIVEGVFRQSDGKTLAELLEDSGGGVTMEQVNAAIQEAVLDSWGASY